MRIENAVQVSITGCDVHMGATDRTIFMSLLKKMGSVALSEQERQMVNELLDGMDEGQAIRELREMDKNRRAARDGKAMS